MGKFGMTNLVSMQLHEAYDADDDGYSDLPALTKMNFNPKLFFHPNKRTEMYLGATVTRETRKGGDMRLLDNKAVDALHFYTDEQLSNRYTTQFKAQRLLDNNGAIAFKNCFSYFDRYINIRKNPAGDRAIFDGQQLSSFSELTYNLPAKSHELIFGANYVTEDFQRQNTGDAYYSPLTELHTTASFFANDVWEAGKFLDLETGLRADWNQNKSNISSDAGKLFFMPRMAALLKYTDKLSSRIGGALGYRPMTVLNEEAEPFGFQYFRAVDFANTKAEQSLGLNGDIAYQSAFGENMLLSLNQRFFYNNIQNPLVLDIASSENLGFVNSANHVISQGFESQVKFTFWKITWFLGYTYTNAFFDNNESELLVLMPKHSVKGDFLFVEDGKWRIGLDYEYKSGQRLSTGKMTRDLFTTGLVIERTLGNFVLFFNAENMTDVRQTRYESLLSLPYNTPQFTEVWAPLDGRFLNFGVKVKLE
jgi:outer membrane receptor for ferrienterochelin and colicins